MKSTTQCLQSADIEAVLSGSVSKQQSELWEQHFSTCDGCREAMASRVGDQEWWREAERSLLGDLTSDGSQRSSEAIDSPESNEQLLELLGPTDDPAMMGRVASYEIVGILGRGGMGAVFKGYDRALNRFVAIKMLLPHLAASGAARKRFAREAQAAAAVVDDHVMAIHGVSEWKSTPYFVMPYARGVSLQKRLTDDGLLNVREILRIGMQTARGLAAAHAQGLVHRDVKPANIFLDQGVERVRLMDFGLARAVDDASLTRSGTLAGTPQYMSPEQARAETVDRRSDLFSLGSVMYAMCVGHAPFRADSSYSVLRLIIDKHPRPIRETNPDAPDWLCAIISKLMSKQESDRFDSAEQVAALLEDCLAHVQQPTTTPLPESVTLLCPGRKRRLPIARILTATVFAFGMILAGVIIVLELNKGTLTIESDVDGVPIRIRQGEDVVGKLTVSKSGESIRVAAGQYIVEVDGDFDGLSMVDGVVSVSRGATETFRITLTDETAVNQSEDSSTPILGRVNALPGRDAVFPMTMKKDALVAELNARSEFLRGWRSTSTMLHVKLPQIPIQRMSGGFACQAPMCLRLTADNFVAQVDLGSNASQCWLHTKPGSEVVYASPHEAASVMPRLPGPFSWVEANWLFMVLGMKELDPTEYELTYTDQESSELWLTATELGPGGLSYRRVIKVDAIAGVIREHGIYDGEGNPRVLVTLRDYEMHEKNSIPSQVQIRLPQADIELTLRFRNIEANSQLSDDLWVRPDYRLPVVNLGQDVELQPIASAPGLQEVTASALSPAAKTFAKLQAEFSELESAYRKAIEEAADKEDVNRVSPEMDPRETMPAKYLEFEEGHRGTGAGLDALREVAEMAADAIDPKSNADQGRVEAADRLVRHYLHHHGLEAFASQFNRFPFYQADDVMQTLVDKSPHRETRARALIAQLIRGKDLLALERRLPTMIREQRQAFAYEDDPASVKVELQKMLTKLENTDFKQLRADLNDKLLRLGQLYSDVPVQAYGTGGVAALRLSHAINKVIVGNEAPEIAAIDISGKPFHLSRLRGRIVVLIFGEGDGDFKELYGPIRQLVAKYKWAEVQFVGIMNAHDQTSLQAAYECGDLNFTVIPQPPDGPPLPLDWGVECYPAVYIVDADGMLQQELGMPDYGAGGYDTREVDDKIAELLKSSPALKSSNDAEEQKGLLAPNEAEAAAFATPESLMQYYADCQFRDDDAGCLACYSDRVIEQFAANYLVTATALLEMYRRIEGDQPDGNQRKSADDLESLINRSMIDDLPTIAKMALSQAAGSIRDEMKGGESREPTQTEAMLTVAAPSLLKEPRRFVLEFSQFGDESPDEGSGEKIRKDYNVESDADGTWSISADDNSRMGLKKMNGRWWIDELWAEVGE